MSLKAFHVFFVAACLLLALGLGVWFTRAYRAGAGDASLYMSIASFVASGLLAVYGAWFLRKLRNLSFV